MVDLINRTILKNILTNLDRKEFLAIIGPRQAGKTTLLQVIQEKLLDDSLIDKNQVYFMTFQDPVLLESFSSNPVSFINSYIQNTDITTYFLIDEFQYARQGGPQLKLIYDTLKNVKIIITGSSSLELRQISSSMVGRILQYEIRQLEFCEIVQNQNNPFKNYYQQSQQLISDFLDGNTDIIIPVPDLHIKMQGETILTNYTRYGSYPAVYLESSEVSKQELLLNIYNTYVEKDLIRLLQIGSIDKLFKLIRYLATTIGQLTNFSNIQSELGMKYDEVKRLITILQETYIIKQIKPYHSNKTSELKKSPIIYFYDTGLRNWTIRNFTTTNIRQDIGHLIENVIFHKLLYLVKHNLELTEIKYWRTTTGAEVDFVIEKLGDKPYVIPIEVKYTKFIKPQITRSYRSFLKKYTPPVGLVITKDFIGKTKFENTTVLFIPAYLV